jgi:hypothetical protein
MKNKGDKAFIAVLAILFLTGGSAGYSLSLHPRLETFKVLNVIGLVYDLLGIIVLSEIIASNTRLRSIALNWMAPGVLWLQTCLPLGVSLGALLAFNAPSMQTAFSFGASFWAWSILPLLFLESTVVLPRFRVLQDPETRWRCFGLFLLLSGVTVQLIAALIDLRS